MPYARMKRSVMQIDPRTALRNRPRQSLSAAGPPYDKKPGGGMPTRLCKKHCPLLAMPASKTHLGKGGHQLIRSHLMLVEALVVSPYVLQRLAGPCNGQTPKIRYLFEKQNQLR